MNPPGTRSIGMEKFRQTILNRDGGHGARAGRDHNLLPAGEVASKMDSAIGSVDERPWRDSGYCWALCGAGLGETKDIDRLASLCGACQWNDRHRGGDS